MGGKNPGDVEGAEVLREENRMVIVFVRFYWVEDCRKFVRRIRSVICAISVGRIAPQWKGVGGDCLVTV